MEWFKRFNQKGGIGCVVPETFIYHYKLCSWRKHSKFKQKTVNDTCYVLTSLQKQINQNNNDVFYFTNNFKSLYKSIKLKLLPMYLQSIDNNPETLLETIKNNTSLYLPNNYKI